MSSTHECNPRTVWALGWQIWGKASRGVTSQRSEVTQLFLSCCGSDVSAGCLDCKLTGNQCHETPRKASRRKKQGPLKDIWLLSPTVNLFMCRSDTAFIYCIYLFGSWISPAVHLHSLAYNFCEVIGKMLLTFCAFYSSWGKKEVKSYDWNIGLLCLLPKKLCSEKHLVLSVHSYCILIVCFYFTKTSTHIQPWKPTCSHFHLASKVTHSIKTNSVINYLSTA